MTMTVAGSYEIKTIIIKGKEDYLAMQIIVCISPLFSEKACALLKLQGVEHPPIIVPLYKECAIQFST